MKELEDFKNIWDAVDAKIEVSSQVNQKLMEEIRNNQISTRLDKMLKESYWGIFVEILCGLVILPLYQIYRFPFSTPSFIALEICCLIAFFSSTYYVYLLSKMDISGSTACLSKTVDQYLCWNKISWRMLILGIIVAIGIMMRYDAYLDDWVVVLVVVAALLATSIVMWLTYLRDKRQTAFISSLKE